MTKSSTDQAGESLLKDLLRGTYRLRLEGVDAIDWASEKIDQRELPPPPKLDDGGYIAPFEGANGPIDEAALDLVFDNDDY